MNKSTIVEYPVEQRLFTAAQISEALDISIARIYSIQHCLKFKAVYFDGKYNHFSYQQFKMIKEHVERYEAKKQARYNAKHNLSEEQEVKPHILELRKLHPLVKDDKFFNLYYWPETIPACYKDVEI